jgi:hypothetical protein
MSLTRQPYDVYLRNPDDVETRHRVEITHADHLRGELEANKQRLPAVKDAPMNHTTVWLWCAMTREGLYGSDYRTFADRDLIGLEPVRDVNGDPEEIPVDPTRPGPVTGSP